MEPTLKVFISWSGDLSNKVALVFKDWLPSVIQSVDAYVSSEDIDKGARWSSDISKALEESFFGILCITKDNINAPWINFEAGALAKSFEKSRISPFLFNISKTQVQGPLVQFQFTIFEKDDIKKLVLSINKACGESCLEEQRVEKTFNMWWPELESKLNTLKKDDSPSQHDPKERKLQKEEILDEILLLVRNQQKILSQPETLLPPDYFRFLQKQTSRFPQERDHPVYIDLYQSFENFSEVLGNIISRSENGEILEPDILREKFERLSRPVDYIIRHHTSIGKKIPKRIIRSIDEEKNE
jgi:hypothetical protein